MKKLFVVAMALLSNLAYSQCKISPEFEKKFYSYLVKKELFERYKIEHYGEPEEAMSQRSKEVDSLLIEAAKVVKNEDDYITMYGNEQKQNPLLVDKHVLKQILDSTSVKKNILAFIKENLKAGKLTKPISSYSARNCFILESFTLISCYLTQNGMNLMISCSN